MPDFPEVSLAGSCSRSSFTPDQHGLSFGLAGLEEAPDRTVSLTSPSDPAGPMRADTDWPDISETGGVALLLHTQPDTVN